MPSGQLEPRDRSIAAVPADDPSQARVGLGRPLHPQLITRRPNDTNAIPARDLGTAPQEAGSAGMPATADCPLTAHTDASDPSGEPSAPTWYTGKQQQREAANPTARQSL
jgi:hypothetical protein